MVVAGLLGERYARIRHLGLLTAPLAFLGLLYPLLLPIRFEEAESILVEYPFLGIHVVLTLLGHVGFALAFCSAVGYLVQHQALKKGGSTAICLLSTRLPRRPFALPAGAFRSLPWVWVWARFGSLARRASTSAGGDTKIWLALPTWFVFGIYLYLRGIGRRHGRRLKWLVIAGFVLGLINLLWVRHDFGQFRLVRRRNGRN